MNDNEINIAIAEACGWKLKRQFAGQDKGIGVWLDANGDLRSWTCIPNCTTDLNAMHGAEKVLNAEQFQDYDIELTDQYVLHQSNNPIHATARQRAEAFLRTLGKWKE